MSSNKTKGAVYGCISAVSYGLNPLCAKALYAEGVNTNTVLFYRFAFGVAILGLMMLASRQSFRLTRREGLVLTLLGALFAFRRSRISSVSTTSLPVWPPRWCLPIQ